MAILIDGKAAAQEIRAEVKAQVDAIIAEGKRVPGLTVIIVGDDPASSIYVRNKERAANKAGINGNIIRLDATISQEELIRVIGELNADDTVDGILVQLPLPKTMSKEKVLAAIAPEKDVDGFHLVNTGALFLDLETMEPCTPEGIIYLLKKYNVQISGKHAVVVGRSRIVGKPVSVMLLQNDATVTI